MKREGDDYDDETHKKVPISANPLGGPVRSLSSDQEIIQQELGQLEKRVESLEHKPEERQQRKIGFLVGYYGVFIIPAALIIIALYLVYLARTLSQSGIAVIIGSIAVIITLVFTVANPARRAHYFDYKQDDKEFLTSLGHAEPNSEESQSRLKKELLDRDKANLIRGRDVTGFVTDEFKCSLLDATEQLKWGYRFTGLMYNIAFYTGIGLLVAAVYFAFVYQGASQSLFTAVFGAAGVTDILAFFITNPPKDLQESRAQLAQLQAVLYTWLLDSKNWNNFLLNAQFQKDDLRNLMKTEMTQKALAAATQGEDESGSTPKQQLQAPLQSMTANLSKKGDSGADEDMDKLCSAYLSSIESDFCLYATVSEKFIKNTEDLTELMSTFFSDQSSAASKDATKPTDLLDKLEQGIKDLRAALKDSNTSTAGTTKGNP